MGEHDLQFKDAFKNPELFKIACRAYLPEDIQQHLNFDTLDLRELSPHFIRDWVIIKNQLDPKKDDKKIRQLTSSMADVAYVCKTTDNSEAILLIHFEHQSTPDSRIAVRMGHYNLSLLKDFVTQHKTPVGQYPMVISLLFYHGQPSPYPYPTNIRETFKNKDLFDRYFMKPIVIDYHQYTDDVLLKHGQLASLELIMKHVNDQKISNEVAEKLALSLKQASEKYKKQWIKYALNYWEVKFDIISEAIIQHAPETEKTMNRYLENFKRKSIEEGVNLGRQEGIDIGRQEGIDIGRQEGLDMGREAGKAEIVANLLAMHFPLEEIAKMTGLSTHAIQKIATQNKIVVTD